MTESTQLHAEMLHALQRLLPKTTSHDPRRLDTLAWAITGLCLKQTVRLWAWAEVAPSRSQHAARRVRRFSELSASSGSFSLRLVSAGDPGSSC